MLVADNHAKWQKKCDEKDLLLLLMTEKCHALLLDVGFGLVHCEFWKMQVRGALVGLLLLFHDSK
jgi:hypothetical protein